MPFIPLSSGLSLPSPPLPSPPLPSSGSVQRQGQQQDAFCDGPGSHDARQGRSGTLHLQVTRPDARKVIRTRPTDAWKGSFAFLVIMNS